ncbi:MAG: 4Fe-4S binding protein [Leptospirillum sp.]
MTGCLSGHDYVVVAKGSMSLDLTLCRQCLECEEICPTGVLVIPSPGRWVQKGGLSIMGVCIACRYCLTFCPDKALSLISKTDGESYS